MGGSGWGAWALRELNERRGRGPWPPGGAGRALRPSSRLRCVTARVMLPSDGQAAQPLLSGAATALPRYRLGGPASTRDSRRSSARFSPGCPRRTWTARCSCTTARRRSGSSRIRSSPTRAARALRQGAHRRHRSARGEAPGPETPPAGGARGRGRHHLHRRQPRPAGAVHDRRQAPHHLRGPAPRSRARTRRGEGHWRHRGLGGGPRPAERRPPTMGAVAGHKSPPETAQPQRIISTASGC